MDLRLDEVSKTFDFTYSVDEQCIYKKASVSKISCLVFYVDGILLIGNDIGMLTSVKAWL